MREIKPGNDIAFPGNEEWMHCGLTKREYFAGLAMHAIIAKHPPISELERMTPDIIAIVKGATDYADALLAELEKSS